MIDIARQHVNAPSLRDANFVIPKRWVSRPQRQNDNTVENAFAADADELREKTPGGIRWRRKMDLKGDREEWYGFEAVPHGALPIYSANNAIISPDSQLECAPADFWDHALIFYIYAYQHIRAQRLEERSPDLIAKKPEEVVMRLAPLTDEIFDQSHFALRTRSIPTEANLAGDTILHLMSSIAKIKEVRE